MPDAPASEQTAKEIVSEVVEQRKTSLNWFNDNFYGEWAEIYRNLHARVKPRYRRTPDGQLIADQSGKYVEEDRTNVCVPDHFVMQRRGTARLTRNPPNLRLVGGPDTETIQGQREKAAAQLMYQWDRSESQKSFKRAVHCGYALGWGIGKSYYDEVPVVRRLRRLTKLLTRKQFMGLKESSDQDISAAVGMMGDKLSEEEISAAIVEYGDDVTLKNKTIRYKGPTLDSVFPGDFFPEPGFRSLNESSYIVENSIRDEDWLKYWKEQTSIDPHDGSEKPVFDEKACQDLLDKAGEHNYTQDKEMSLRRRMREEIEIGEPTEKAKFKSGRKRFVVDERHSIIDGYLCIDFVGDEDKYLGRLWYPWDTYGRYTYSELVMIPDLLGGVGQSTLRVTRFLMMLRNTRLNQTTDFINNKLLPLAKTRTGSDFTSYDLIRTGWARLVEMENLNDLDFVRDPSFPSEAWQDQAQYQQQMQAADPSTVDFAPGTADVQQSGKFATTALLQSKASDSVTADTLDNVGFFVRDVAELWLWMNQQAMDEALEVPKQYFERIDAESIRDGGNAKTIRIDPMEIQEDMEILPEQGSTLASDDEFKIGALQRFAAIGERHPEIVNLRAVLTKMAKATPGISAEEVILPEQPPQEQGPDIKTNISIAIKWPDLPPDVQAALLQKEGLPTEMAHVEGLAKTLGKVREAADDATELDSPAQGESEKQAPNGRVAATV